VGLPGALPGGLRARRPEPEEWDAFFGSLDRAFGGTADGDAQRVELWRAKTELDRSTAVWDGGQVVATAGAFTFRMAVPGGALLPTAGVTMVSVATTHRRRGLLTAMMRAQLDEVRERGEPLAALTASETPIYGRFGYGLATQELLVTADTAGVRVQGPPEPAGLRLRFTEPADSLDACERVFAAAIPGRPGMLVAPPVWRRDALLSGPHARKGGSRPLCVVAELPTADGFETVGYARYGVRAAEHDGIPAHEVMVRDVQAADPAVYAALWRYLFSVDLAATVTCDNRPVDDPLQHLVNDPRRLRGRVRDGMFVRLVDVGAALAARRYQAPVDAVLEVSDPFCPWNAGRWRLTGGPDGAECVRATGDPDLELSARTLASAYLGCVSLGALARAGRVRERRAGALAAASAAFGWEVAPWLPFGF
jgi:predicted acetyltransferase